MVVEVVRRLQSLVAVEEVVVEVVEVVEQAYPIRFRKKSRRSGEVDTQILKTNLCF
jgi:hypothetical protein